ncbi:hypothetical protein CYMTET_39911 [Cymbomonas tetramitiformis]|uniref:SUI1 domain-containing protein n=1 Tax=Cymbomonas tetramitiformis TaxID=36881 RepID=A0AAE0C975_9CHLO|nr:hypothetical protein CYMTET_39911 [Cymbomonas tetramitiformis]
MLVHGARSAFVWSNFTHNKFVENRGRRSLPDVRPSFTQFSLQTSHLQPQRIRFVAHAKKKGYSSESLNGSFGGNDALQALRKRLQEEGSERDESSKLPTSKNAQVSSTKESSSQDTPVEIRRGPRRTPKPPKAASSNTQTLPLAQQQVRVQATRQGRGGKTVSVITGLTGDSAVLKALLKKLKAKCGAGGKVAGNDIEIQGDNAARLVDLLIKLGYTNAKRSGG